MRALKSRYVEPEVPPPLGPADLALNLHPHPSGSALPATLLHTNFAATSDRARLPECLVDAGKVCDAVQLDVTGDGKPDVILLPQDNGYARVVSETASGQWALVGTISVGRCKTVRAALLGGAAHSVEPALRDVDAGGQRLHVEPVDPPDAKPACVPGS